MIPFTSFEILASIFSATIFGAFFAFLNLVLKILNLEIRHISKIGEHLFNSKNIFSIPKRRALITAEPPKRHKYLSEISTFFKVIIFDVGFILLSYYALDGEIRAYLLFFSIGFFILFNSLFDKTLLKITDVFFVFIYGVFVVFLRLSLRPLLLAIKKIKKENKKITEKSRG